jgi:hypothetical protein
VAERTFRWLKGEDAGETVTVTTEGSYQGEYRIVGQPGAWAQPEDVDLWLRSGLVEELTTDG